MKTFKTNNSISNINLTCPLKQSEHQPVPIIASYALILLWAYQNGNSCQGFSKKQLVGEALGYLDYRFKAWDMSPAGFCSEFAAFNHNRVLTYNKHKRLWFVGNNLREYLVYHFGPNSRVPLCGWKPYDEAVAYNNGAVNQCTTVKQLYQMQKQIGRHYFFQE